MIDRKARLELAYAIRAFATGRITNGEYEELVPVSDDPIINQIDDEMWAIYDDLKIHYAKGKHRLDHITKRGVARSILFLNSERPYLWPIPTRVSSNFLGFITRGKYGQSKRITKRDFYDAGDISCWPFLNRNALHAEANIRRSGLSLKALN